MNLLERFLKGEKPCKYYKRSINFYITDCNNKIHRKNIKDRCPYCYKPVYVIDFLQEAIMKARIWVDDVRPMPKESYVWCKFLEQK